MIQTFRVRVRVRARVRVRDPNLLEERRRAILPQEAPTVVRKY